MVCLRIYAEISNNKMLEFNQSKVDFINKLQKVEGYSGFTERQSNQFRIDINWESQELLEAFMKTEQYKYFHGAIITLSDSIRVKIIKE